MFRRKIASLMLLLVTEKIFRNVGPQYGLLALNIRRELIKYEAGTVGFYRCAQI